MSASGTTGPIRIDDAEATWHDRNRAVRERLTRRVL